MSEANKELIRRWFEEVWNRGRAEAIDEMFAEEGVAHDLGETGGRALRGPSEFKIFFRKFRDAFPDIEVVVADTVAEGDKVAARCVVRGKHQGDTLGFAATHQPIEISGMTMARIRDGKIVEAWNNFDFLSMFQQLGALPMAAHDAAGGGESLPSLD